MSEKLGSPWRTPEEGSLLLAAIRFAVRRFGWLLRAYGIDERVLHEILRARLLIGLRTQAQEGDASGITGLVLVILGCAGAGLMTGLIALLSPDARLWILGSQGALLLLLWMSLVSQFAALLVDPSDVGTLAPHPVEDRTLFAARLVHVFALLLIFTLSFAGANMFLALFGKPVVAVLLVFPLVSLLCALVALGGVALPMAALLRIVGPAHFQRLSLWLQIAAAAFAFGGYQVLFRLVPHETVERMWTEQHWLLGLLPPMQYAALFDLACGTWTRSNMILSAVALLTPPLAFALTFWLASRYFVAGLQGTLSTGRQPRSGWGRGWAREIDERLGSTRERRAGFDFTVALTRREPFFLRTLVPQAIGFQFITLGMLEFVDKAPQVFVAISTGMLAITLPSLLECSQCTQVPEARWIFQATPLESEDELLRGGLRAQLVAWWAPIAALLTLVQANLAGWHLWPEILLAQLLTFATALAFARSFKLGVPFTRPVQASAGAFDNVGLILLMFLAVAVLVGIQFLLSLVPFGTWIGLAAGVLVTVHGWRALQEVRISPARRMIGALGLVLEQKPRAGAE